jgi:hypothetical protein
MYIACIRPIPKKWQEFTANLFYLVHQTLFLINICLFLFVSACPLGYRFTSKRGCVCKYSEFFGGLAWLRKYFVFFSSDLFIYKADTCRPRLTEYGGHMKYT